MKILIKYVEELVKEIAGSDVVRLVELMFNKDYISEFKLADKLEISVNQTRNMLYRLHSFNLVDFIRKKDKKKGWYIYYWIFDLKLAKELIIDLKQRRLAILTRRLEHEKEDFFVCPNKCIRLNFVNAMESQFKCEECGKILIREDNIKRAEKVGKEIKRLVEDLKKIAEIKVVLKSKEEKLKKAKERVVKKKKAKKKQIKRKPKKKVKKKKAKKKQIKRKPKKKVKKKKAKKKKAKERVVKKKKAKKKPKKKSIKRKQKKKKSKR